MDRLLVTTTEREQMVNITHSVQAMIRSKRWINGTMKLFCPHTTASLTFTEGNDPAVGRDFLGALTRSIPYGGGWNHSGNAEAHVKSALVGHNVEIFVERGQILFGSWQGVFFCEFDGPRPREVWVKWFGC
ncbi:MAG: secondary thiamine-phosphate synthase enzyme YjbQ [Proteobacteria bacterium]|nr:secondary thiamine-phosphate synthase enzyme YjbQ [Pseudomonadota bacterium]